MRKLIFAALLLSSVARAQSPAELQFLPAPSVSSPLHVPAQVLTRSGGRYDFSKLDRFIVNNKVLLLGENHWMNEVHQLLTDLVLHANTRSYYPLLVLEIQYSATAAVNAYLHADSLTAQRYMTAIKPIMKSKESWHLLRTLREWNAEHPDKKISIACSDIEHGLGYGLRYVFDPYFKALGEERLIPLITQANELTPQIQAFMDSVLRSAPTDFRVPDAPYLNQAFVNNVWVNMKETLVANQAMETSGYGGYAQVRAERIFKNLTDDAFFGQPLKAGKTIIWGGALHTKTHDLNPAPPHWEGWRLAYEFGPTQGKVHSIRVTNFAYAIPAPYYRAETYRRATESFAHLVDSYKKEVPDSTSGRYLILDELTDFSAALVRQSQAHDNLPVWVNREMLLKLAEQHPGLTEDPIWQGFMGHETIISVPQATLFDYSE